MSFVVCQVALRKNPDFFDIKPKFTGNSIIFLLKKKKEKKTIIFLFPYCL